MTRWKQYLYSLPIRIVMAAAVFALAYGASLIWPHKAPEEPAPAAAFGPAPTGCYGPDCMYQKQIDANLDAQVQLQKNK